MIENNKKSKYIVLSSGEHIPDICYGTGIISHCFTEPKLLYRYLRELKYCVSHHAQYKKERGVIRAIETYKDLENTAFFDTSSAYGGSEKVLGSILDAYNRESFFISTKLQNVDQIHGLSATEALQRSLKNLGLKYVDLYLIHWPVTNTWLKYWKELEQLYKKGLCKSIGVCNCNIHHLEELKSIADIMPAVNQVECHPLFTQNSLRMYCEKNNIRVMAYTSTARMDERLKKTVLSDLAKKYNKTTTQIILKWHKQIGNIPIFNTSNPEHIRMNLDIDDFVLDNGEIEQITAININSRLRYDPDNCDFGQL